MSLAERPPPIWASEVKVASRRGLASAEICRGRSQQRDPTLRGRTHPLVALQGRWAFERPWEQKGRLGRFSWVLIGLKATVPTRSKEMGVEKKKKKKRIE